MESELGPFKANYRRGYSPLTELWWNSLLTGSRDIPVQGTPAEVADLLAAVNGTAENEIPNSGAEEVHSGQLSLGLRLEPPANEGDAWNLTFWAENREEGEFWIPAAAIWSSREREFTLWGKRYRNIQQQLLAALGRAAKISPDIERALAGPAPDGVQLEPDRVYFFLKESVQQLRERGITVQMPSRWSREGRRRIGMKMKMQPPGGSIDGSTQPSLGMEELISFRIEASLGDNTISEEELNALVEAGVPFVRFRGEWIEVDPKEIRQVLRYMKRNESGEMSAADWMRLEAEDGDERLWKGMSVTGMETSGMLASLMHGDVLRGLPLRSVPQGLHGTLRPYQERGFQWLAALSGLGFGVCLADDMGLGKTVQVITCLLDRALTAPPEEKREPVLILCPTSLLGNWQRELQRFAPSLSVHIHHGEDGFAGKASSTWPPAMKSC